MKVKLKKKGPDLKPTREEKEVARLVNNEVKEMTDGFDLFRQGMRGLILAQAFLRKKGLLKEFDIYAKRMELICQQ